MNISNNSILTHFTEKTYFKDKPFYFSAIIPDSTFSLSEGGDNLFVSVDLFNGSTPVNSDNFKITNTGEGVYTVDISTVIPDECIWTNGTVQFIIVPSNVYTDGDNGTFEDGVPVNWNYTILPYSGGTPNQVGATIISNTFGRTGDHSCNEEWSAPSMNEVSKVYSLFKNDTVVSVIEGELS